MSEDETKNARRDSLNPFILAGRENGWGVDTWNDGFDACEREMSAEAALTRLGIETYIDALEASKKERDKLKEQCAKLEAKIKDCEASFSYLKAREQTEQLTQYREMCEKLAEALEKYKGVTAFVSVPTNYGQDLRHSAHLVSDKTLADYKTFLETQK